MHTYYNPYPQHSDIVYGQLTERLAAALATYVAAAAALEATADSVVPLLLQHHAEQKLGATRAIAEAKATIYNTAIATTKRVEALKQNTLMDIDQQRAQWAAQQRKAKMDKRLRSKDIATMQLDGTHGTWSYTPHEFVNGELKAGPRKPAPPTLVNELQGR